jgi:hypothetical protein
MIRFLCWLLRRKRPVSPPCPDFIPDLPPFIAEAQRNRLQAAWDLNEYQEAVDEWSCYIDQPHVIENARGFLEAQWKK